MAFDGGSPAGSGGSARAAWRAAAWAPLMEPRRGLRLRVISPPLRPTPPPAAFVVDFIIRGLLEPMAITRLNW